MATMLTLVWSGRRQVGVPVTPPKPVPLFSHGGGGVLEQDRPDCPETWMSRVSIVETASRSLVWTRWLLQELGPFARSEGA